MATYFITRHAWLQRREDLGPARREKISVSNVSTMRRALLTPEQLGELEHYAQGAELLPGELSQRLLEADLLVSEHAEPAENPRQSAIFFAIDKFLAEQNRVSRSRLLQQHPDPAQRLDLVQELVSQQMASVGLRQDKWQRRSGVDDFLALLDHVRTFLKEDAPDPGAFRFPAGYLSSTAGRPLPRYDYEQQPCMPATTVKRVQQATAGLRQDSKGLILGDDDLISLFWSGQLKNPADVFELDSELIEFLRAQLGENVSIRQRDLTKGLPEEFRGLYDVVFTDPMYRADGMDLFMLCAASGLSERPEARVFFSTRPDLIQRGRQLEDRLADAGLAIETRLPNFSRYRLPDFSRKLILRDFRAWQAPVQLVDGLLNIAYFYADLFVLKKA
jgi:hypothetical protein